MITAISQKFTREDEEGICLSFTTVFFVLFLTGCDICWRWLPGATIPTYSSRNIWGPDCSQSSKGGSTVQRIPTICLWISVTEESYITSCTVFCVIDICLFNMIFWSSHMSRVVESGWSGEPIRCQTFTRARGAGVRTPSLILQESLRAFYLFHTSGLSHCCGR